MMASSSPAFSGTALPRRKSQAAMPSPSRRVELQRLTPMPPVERPMRCVSATKSSLPVPVCVSAREKIGR